MNMDKIDTNPLLVNINKLKPYQHLELTPYGLEAKIEKGRDVSVRVPQQWNGKISDSTTWSDSNSKLEVVPKPPTKIGKLIWKLVIENELSIPIEEILQIEESILDTKIKIKKTFLEVVPNDKSNENPKCNDNSNLLEPTTDFDNMKCINDSNIS